MTQELKPYVKRNAPGHDGDGGEVVVPFTTDAEMAAVLAAIARARPSADTEATSLHGPHGYLNGNRGLNEEYWRLEGEPDNGGPEYFSIPLYALSDPFSEIGKVVPPSSADADAAGVVVKPLEWVEGEARSSLGDLYSVRKLSSIVHQLLLNGTSLTGGWFPSVEAAQAAAQADYERRSRSSLVASQPPGMPAPRGFSGWKDQLLRIQSLLPDEDPQNQESVLSIVDEMLEGFEDVTSTEAILAQPPAPVVTGEEKRLRGVLQQIAARAEDMVKKKRQAVGSKINHSKLTEEDVRYIRSRPETASQMARTLGVHPSSVSDVLRGKCWSWVI